MQEQQPATEIIHLPTAGSIPGIPGSHGPGRYIINWVERTIAPLVDAAESVVEHVEEALHPEESAPAPDAPADVPASEPAPEAAPPEQAGESAPVEETSAN